MTKTNTHFLKFFCLLLGTLFWSGNVFAQPANDLCANATVLTCGATLIGETTVGSTDQSGDIGCGMGTGIWYTFVGTGDNVTLAITNDAFDVEVGVASGDCGALTNVSCTDGGTTSETVNITPAIAGTVYYFYIGDWLTGGTDAGTYDLALTCVIPPLPPANDECITAIDLGAAEIGTCTGITAGTTVASTESLPGCIGTANDDVWFSFTATGTDQDITITNTAGSTDIVTEVFDGCGGTSLACQDTPNSPINLTGLTVGNTYLFRVYTWTSVLTTTSDFTVCVGSPAGPPANDDCANAIDLGAAEVGACIGTTASTTIGATESLPGCIGTANDDVWFSFMATGTDQEITVTNTGGSTDIVTEVFDGCGGTSLACQDTPNSPITLTGLTIGDTYLFRIYTWSAVNGTRSDFTVCVGSPPPPPANDNCAGVIDLGTQTSPLTATTENALNDFVGDCLTNTAAPDIFYSIVVPAESTLVIGQTANAYDSEIRLAYGATCPGDILIVCQDDPDVDNFTWANTTGMDQTVYWTQSAFSTGEGEFTLAWEILDPPANNLCASAVDLAVAEGEMCDGLTLGTNAVATASGELPDPSCGTIGIGQDVWYSVIVPTSGAVNVEVSDAAGPTDWGVAIYSGTCGALVEEACASGTFPTALATGVTPGEVLLVRVFEDGSDEEGAFNICAFSPALVCDLAITSSVATDETCIGASDGTITIVTTTSFGPVTYAIDGAVSMTNATGIFTDLPQGDYTFTVTDDGFPTTAGPCMVIGDPLTIVGDTQAPTIVCPADTEVTCDAIPMAVNTVEDFAAQGGIIEDNCGIASLIATNVIDGDNCPATGAQTITRVYTVTDGSGNTATCAQIITVTNSNTAPIITSFPPDQTVDCAVDAFAQMNFFEATGNCNSNITTTVTEMPTTGTPGCNGASIRFMYTATDDCGRETTHIQTFTLTNEGPEFVCPSDICIIECPADNDMIQAQFDAYAELATVITSCSENDVTITNSFNPNSFINQNCMNPTVDVEGAVSYQVVTFNATDFCGRSSSCTALVVIKDNDGPEISGNVTAGVADCATANLQPGYDAWINLTLSNLSATDACSGSPANITYSPLSPNSDCQGGLATTEVTFVATDACGNQTIIDAFYRTIDYTAIPMAVVSGSLMTEENEAVEQVQVDADGGSFSSMMISSVDGTYAFDLEIDQNHAITPTRNDNPLNGISSYDIILMGQHILQIQSLNSPYKLIAADVNNSGGISILDMIELRRMVLHIQDEFTNNTSWRFVDADYSFPNMANPFATTFPEAIAINNLTQTELRDFVAIKVGDLNGSASPTLLNEEGDTRDLNKMVFQVEDQQLSADQTYTVDFKAKDFNDILGYQFTLAFDPTQLEMVDFETGALNLSADNFGDLAKEGLLTSSWDEIRGLSIEDDATLFSITFKANANVNLSQAIRLNSDLTSAEAYSQNESLMNLGLEFNTETGINSDKFALLQNRPNPFNNETLIAFNLPEMTTAKLTIYDVAGRVLKQYKGDFSKGYNEITINRADLSGSGLLYYQLETPTEVATMKMIVQ